MDNEPDTNTGAEGAVAPEGFAVVVARGSVVMRSSGAGRLLGYEPEEAVGRPASDLLAAEPAVSVRRRMAAGKPWGSGVALRHRDGGRVVAQLQGNAAGER